MPLLKDVAEMQHKKDSYQTDKQATVELEMKAAMMKECGGLKQQLRTSQDECLAGGAGQDQVQLSAAGFKEVRATAPLAGDHVLYIPTTSQAGREKLALQLQRNSSLEQDQSSKEESTLLDEMCATSQQRLQRSEEQLLLQVQRSQCRLSNKRTALAAGSEEQCSGAGAKGNKRTALAAGSKNCAGELRNKRTALAAQYCRQADKKTAAAGCRRLGKEACAVRLAGAGAEGNNRTAHPAGGKMHHTGTYAAKKKSTHNKAHTLLKNIHIWEYMDGQEN
ncbi:hypothetical protein WMY93_017664 [Mugilogobius chulae]|uniref:Uncharacterized protein n=1 Tax=Mugilogobius chulae TaxID=88201 RepID=A0AAW0NZZ7_9GOBI